MHTHYLGLPHKPALVCLHGFMGSGADWLPLAEALSRDFYCLLPDLPGHGETPLDEAPGYAAWSEALRQTLLAHGVERATLLGYSLGGRLALYFSLTYPQMVQRLVLESAGPGLSDPAERQQRAAGDDKLAADILQGGLEAFLQRWYDQPLFASLARHPELKAQLRQQRARQSAPAAAAVIAALSPGRQPDLWPRLAEIQQPTLLLAGRLDEKYTAALSRAAQMMPQAELTLFDECGHNIHQENPPGYLTALQNWLSQTPIPAAPGPLVAFQGEPGAYSEAAIFEHFGAAARSLPCPSFDAAFEAVKQGRAELACLPLENSLAGSIHRNYDLLLQNDLTIVGEHILAVRHCLVGLPGAGLEKLRRALSHPQALAQCEATLRRLGLEPEAFSDTAGSVKRVKALGDPALAAIASRRAAELYGLPVLLEDIQDNPANYTRFVIVGRQALDAGPAAKTSLVFALPNQPGALFKALSAFALRGIDLTKIESRPLAGKPWEYFFYIDFIGSPADDNCRRALAHLGEYATFLRVLGSYSRGSQ